MLRTILLKSLRYLAAARMRYWQAAGWLVLWTYGAEQRGAIRFYGLPIISVSPNSTIIVGENVVLCSDSRFTALGVNHPVVLRTLRPNARICIGPNTGISGGSICAAVSVYIGAECLIGADVQISDTDFHPIPSKRRRFEQDPRSIASKAIYIDDNVFIGAGTRVLKGVTIGRNSVIGAGSIVTRSIPPDVIAAGVPAVVVAKIPPAHGMDSVKSSKSNH